MVVAAAAAVSGNPNMDPGPMTGRPGGWGAGRIGHSIMDYVD